MAIQEILAGRPGRTLCESGVDRCGVPDVATATHGLSNPGGMRIMRCHLPPRGVRTGHGRDRKGRGAGAHDRARTDGWGARAPAQRVEPRPDARGRGQPLRRRTSGPRACIEGSSIVNKVRSVGIPAASRTRMVGRIIESPGNSQSCYGRCRREVPRHCDSEAVDPSKESP